MERVKFRKATCLILSSKSADWQWRKERFFESTAFPHNKAHKKRKCAKKRNVARLIDLHGRDNLCPPEFGAILRSKGSCPEKAMFFGNQAFRVILHFLVLCCCVRQPSRTWFRFSLFLLRNSSFVGGARTQSGKNLDKHRLPFSMCTMITPTKSNWHSLVFLCKQLKCSRIRQALTTKCKRQGCRNRLASEFGCWTGSVKLGKQQKHK
jgi:hypothetical protein